MKKIHINHRLATLILTLLLPITTVTSSVLAVGQSKSSMFVTPMMQEVLLMPGESYSGVIKVANDAQAEEALEYNVRVGSYSRQHNEEDNDDYGAVDVETISSHNQIMDWITLDKTSGTVNPNDTDKITYTIDVPNDAPAGAQYASIIFINASAEDNEDGGSAIKSRLQIASAIIANIAGESIEKGQIINNSFPSIVTNGNLEATSIVRNDGNIYTRAEHILQVFPIFSDEEVCTNEEDEDSSLILPDTERYHAQTCELPGIGLYRAKQTVKIFDEVSTVEKMVVYCPLWLMFVIVALIVAIIVWLVMRSKSRKK